jgi:predicted DsbA family dithiol-disulfide isomerase
MGEITIVVGIAHLIANNPSNLFSIPNLSCEDVLRQLMKEFGFDVGKVIDDLVGSGSADEMEEEMEKLLMVNT